MAVPAGWTVNRELIAAGGPLSMNNFRGAYDRGGIVPAGGVEIEITSVPAPSNLTQYIQNELKGTQSQRLQESAENGKQGVRAEYTEVLSTDVSLSTVVFYVPRGSTLYKFYLSYRTGAPGAGEWQTVFRAVIGDAELR